MSSHKQRQNRLRVAVGTDLQRVADVEESITAFGQRYLQSVYTINEMRTCTDSEGVLQPHRLAARFAAKEAAIKALRPSHGFAMNKVEVIVDSDGAPRIACHGRARHMAKPSLLARSSVSLSHDGEYAMAVFVAISG